ncbi:DUF3563 family protein [Caballeronia sp. Lep1P3]|uniref:DUF3563 family protein n=1 Tax=Caballeronia sp. Lep1P3 TaxID=2878150 RepID=UPI001FD12747|nr:DUF3563 family protein [Caballeronia sp. Lep1P3]
MFQRLSKSLGDLFHTREDRAIDAYLASSSDLADLEHRMRIVEHRDRIDSLPFCGAIKPRDDALRF